MSAANGTDHSKAGTKDSARKRLYRFGAYAALAAFAIVVIEGTADFIIQTAWLNSGSYGASYGLQPSTVIGWFQLFQNNRLVGLIDDAVS